MATRKAEVIYIGDAASIVRASREAEAATSKAASGISNSHGLISGSFGRMAKSAIAGGAAIAGAYISFEAAKKAIDSVKSLTEETIKLTHVTGLNVKSASAYAAVAQVNGLSSQKLGQAFGTLAKNAEAVTLASGKQQAKIAALGTSHKDTLEKGKLLTAGLGKQAEAFQRLGIPVSTILADHGNMNLLLPQVTQAFTNMKPGVDKTATAMALFGRGWQTLVPLMRSGALGLKDQLQAAKDMGATLSGKPVKSLEELQAAQNKAKYATLGLQLSFGEYLAPAITKVMAGVAKLVVGFRDGTGAGGKIRDVFNQVVSVGKGVVKVVSDIVGWLKKNQTIAVVLAGAIGGVVIALTAMKVATIAQAVAMGILDAVMDANPIVLVAVAVAAVIGALVALEMKTHFVEKAWRALKEAFSAVVNWIGNAATTAFNAVKGAIESGLQGPVNVVKNLWNGVPGFFKGVWNAIVSAVKAVAGALLDTVKSVVMAPVNWIKGLFNTLYDIGKFIIQGLINGIKALAGAVVNTIKNVVMAPVNAVKSVLKIFSPSQVFHDIGVNMMQGLVNGLLSMKEIIADGLNQAMLYPIDSAISALQAKQAALQASWAKIDAASQRSQLVAAVAEAQAGGGTSGTGSFATSGAGSGRVPSGVQKMLDFALQSVGGPYSQAQHASAFNELPSAIRKFGTDCSGFVSALLKAGGSGITAPQTTQGLPTSAGLAKGAGRYVTVFDRSTGSVANEHTLIEIMGKFFESGGSSRFNRSGGISQLTSAQAAGELSGGGFQAYHPTRLNSPVGAMIARVTAVMKSGKLNADQIRGLLYAAGFRGGDLDTAVAIAFAESRGDTNATHKNTNGSIDRGFMQINSVHGSMSTTNPAKNAASAFAIYKAAGHRFTDWSTFNSGAFRQFLGHTGSGTGSLASSVSAAMSPSGGGGSTGNVSQAIQALKDFDEQARRAAILAKIDLQIKNLNQLKAFKDAITALKTQLKDLASQAAQAWKTIQTANINAAHTAAIAAIGNSPAAQQLRAMQSQDVASQNAQQLSTLNQAITDAQFQVAHSGGQTHVDALVQLKAAQQALTDYLHQQDEQRLQDQIDTATAAADATQQTALDGLDQQTVDYQNALDAQLGALTDSLNARKINYANWAQDVNNILASYGLSVSTDGSTEITVDAGPGAVAASTTVRRRTTRGTGGGGGAIRGVHRLHRAGGGPVEPGYVYRVGEQGPEDVVFGHSGTVMTAAQTRRGGGGVRIDKAYFTGTSAARAFADRLAYRAAIGTA